MRKFVVKNLVITDQGLFDADPFFVDFKEGSYYDVFDGNIPNRQVCDSCEFDLVDETPENWNDLKREYYILDDETDEILETFYTLQDLENRKNEIYSEKHRVSYRCEIVE